MDDLDEQIDDLEAQAEALEIAHDAKATLQARTKNKMARLRSYQANSSRKIENLERDRQALLYRAAGSTYASIARALGFSNEQTARAAVLRALEKQKADTTDVMREMSNLRLQGAIMAIWRQVEKGNFLAIDRLIKIEERLAKLWGLDAEFYDKKQEAINNTTNNTVNVTIGRIDEKVENLPQGLNWNEVRAAYSAIFKERYGINAPWEDDANDNRASLLLEAATQADLQGFETKANFTRPTDLPHDPRNNPEGVVILKSGDIIDRQDIVIDTKKSRKRLSYGDEQ